eukprot:scaffold32367_cov22-Tisochrysis_lutea.AAC.1
MSFQPKSNLHIVACLNASICPVELCKGPGPLSAAHLYLLGDLQVQNSSCKEQVLTTPQGWAGPWIERLE